MKKIVLIFCLLILFGKLNAQVAIENMNSYYPPSPEAASMLGKSSNYSINYYTGKLTYSVPLFEQVVSGISINVGLQYSTSGFKVQEVSGSAGLGWNLTAGGVISRYVEGLPDEEENGYCGTNQIGNRTYNSLNEEYFKKITAGEWDSQPDKFFFSFFGITGTIRLTTDGEPILNSSMSGLKMEYSPFNRVNGRSNGGAEEWIIKDQKGNRYFFGKENIETTSSKLIQGTNTTEKTFISSWFITKIVTAANQSIYFKYIKGESTTQVYYVNTRVSVETSNTCSSTGPSLGTENVHTIINEPLYLSQIVSQKNDVAIKFFYNQIREDLSGGKALTDISLSYNNIDKKKIALIYGYFLSTDGSGTKRLKLNKIKEISTTGDSNQLYQFVYNEETVLPARNSIKTDYWGYYNNNTGGSNIEGYLNCSKVPDLLNTKACVLDKVINKTRGVIRFEYELNTYYSGNTNVVGGGLRVKRKYEKVKDDLHSIDVLQEEYSYKDGGGQFSSGQLYLSQENRELKYQLTTFYNQGGVVWPCVAVFSKKYSEPLISIFDLNENSIGYSNVSVNTPSGLTKYSFTNFSDKPDELEEGTFGEPVNSTFANIRPQFPSTSYAFVRGKMKSEEFFDLNNQKVKSNLYEYEYTEPSSIIIGIKAFPMGVLGSNVTYRYGTYKYFNQDYRIKIKTETLFKSGSSINVTKDELFYNSTVKNLISVKKTSNISGRTIKQVFSYPFEDINDAVLSEMSTRNMIGVPFKIEKFVNNIFSSRETINFHIWPSGIIAPVSKKQLIGSGSEITSFLYNNYDLEGNLLEMQQPNGIITSFVWGYNGQYLVAKIVGSDYNSITPLISQSVLINPASDQQLQSELNNLRSGLATAQVITYTYEPLVGMTSQTDLRGQSIYYQYDDFQRLKYIKDQNKHIVKEYSYNFLGGLLGNEIASQTFRKRGCPVAYYGEKVEYKVPSNTHFAKVLEDANALALAEINLKGQINADANGQCFQKGIYVSICGSNSRTATIGNYLYSYVTYSINVFSDHYGEIPYNRPVDINVNTDGFIQSQTITANLSLGEFVVSRLYVGPMPPGTDGELIYYPMPEIAAGENYVVLGNFIGCGGAFEDIPLVATPIAGLFKLPAAFFSSVDRLVSYSKSPGQLLLEDATIYSEASMFNEANLLQNYYGDTTRSVFATNGYYTLLETGSSASKGYKYYHIVNGRLDSIGWSGDYVATSPTDPLNEFDLFIASNKNEACSENLLFEIKLYSYNNLSSGAALPGTEPQLFYTDAALTMIAPTGYYTKYEMDSGHGGYRLYFIAFGQLMFTTWCLEPDPQ